MAKNRNWDRLAEKLKREVATQERINYITQSKLPKEYAGFRDDLGFQLGDGTIYVITDNIIKGKGSIQETIKHELAHSVLRHTQPHEVGERKTVPRWKIIRQVPVALQHEIEVSILLYRAYGFPDTKSFMGELGSWIELYRKVGVPPGYIYAAIRKVILNNQDVPSEWKDAVLQDREKADRRLAAMYGHDVDFVRSILALDKTPDRGLNNLVKHVWYGMISGVRDDEGDEGELIVPEKPVARTTEGRAKGIRKKRKKPMKKRVRTKARGAGNGPPTTLGGMR